MHYLLWAANADVGPTRRMVRSKDEPRRDVTVELTERYTHLAGKARATKSVPSNLPDPARAGCA